MFSNNKDKKAENFIRLANARVNKILETLRLLGNLSNPVNYIYTEEQTEQIVSALRDAVDKLELQFKSHSENTDRPKFILNPDESFPAKKRVHVRGFAEEIGVEGYDTYIDVDATVLTQPRITDKQVLVVLDELKGERAVYTFVDKAAVSEVVIP